jgi:hypothetical protein
VSATADENTQSDLLAEFPVESDETSTFVLWPADPERENAGRLRIDLDDGRTWPGGSITVEARVSVPGPQEVRAVFRVQGLEAPWCPPPQVVTVSPGATARLYLKLSPVAGTPPGRYLWSLTAEVPDRPMLAVTAELRVERPVPVAPPKRRSRWRLVALLMALVAALAALVTLSVLAPTRLPWGAETAAPAPSAGPRDPRATARPTARPARPTAPTAPTARPGAAASGSAAALVHLRGTVLTGEGKRATRITVVRLSTEDLTGTRPTSAGAVPTTPAIGTKVHGKHWSLSLPPGLYALTFSKPGYRSESIVVATTMAGTVPHPHVRLARLTPSPTSTAGS